MGATGYCSIMKPHGVPLLDLSGPRPVIYRRALLGDGRYPHIVKAVLPVRGMRGDSERSRAYVRAAGSELETYRWQVGGADILRRRTVFLVRAMTTAM